MARKQTLIHLHGSSRLNNVSLLNKGEIAVTHAETKEATELAVKTTVDGADVLVYIPSFDKVEGAINTAKTGAEATAKGYAEAAEAAAKEHADGIKTDLQGKIDAINELVGDTGVAAQISAAVAAEAAIARAAEKALQDEDAAIREDFAQADLDLKNALEEYADEAAAAAEGAAKEHATELDNAMNLRVKSLEDDTHTHTNKAELDKIEVGDKAKWDTASDRINTFMDSEEITGTIDTLHEINNWLKGDGVDAGELTAAISAEAKARSDEDAAIREDFAQADLDLKNALEEYAEQVAGAAQEAAENYADGLAKNYDSAGSASAAENAAKEHATQLNNAMDLRVDALEAKFGEGEGSVAEQIANAIEAEGKRSDKYTDDALEEAIGVYTAENVVATGLRKEIEDAKKAAKDYTDAREVEITSAFGIAIENAIKAIDLEHTGTGENTGIDVTVKITDGETITVSIDDSNLTIDCGTY